MWQSVEWNVQAGRWNCMCPLRRRGQTDGWGGLDLKIKQTSLDFQIFQQTIPDLQIFQQPIWTSRFSCKLILTSRFCSWCTSYQPIRCSSTLPTSSWRRWLDYLQVTLQRNNLDVAIITGSGFTIKRTVFRTLIIAFLLFLAESLPTFSGILQVGWSTALLERLMIVSLQIPVLSPSQLYFSTVILNYISQLYFLTVFLNCISFERMTIVSSWSLLCSSPRSPSSSPPCSTWGWPARLNMPKKETTGARNNNDGIVFDQSTTLTEMVLMMLVTMRMPSQWYSSPSSWKF